MKTSNVNKENFHLSNLYDTSNDRETLLYFTEFSNEEIVYVSGGIDLKKKIFRKSQYIIMLQPP